MRLLARWPRGCPGTHRSRDLDGDGHGDLLARDTSGNLWLYPGNGHGSFGARKLIGGGWGQMSTFLSVGDVDGDGRLDLVAATQDGYEYPDAGSTANQLRLYAGNGKGAFAKYRLLHQSCACATSTGCAWPSTPATRRSSEPSARRSRQPMPDRFVLHSKRAGMLEPAWVGNPGHPRPRSGMRSPGS
ncbi:VCBS repeat-containing protein [Streptomyces sp. NPDC004533]|uniref:FG-GAP repeat domain-containing protein n=1 Tax=Streptomyces sp. NPDC004533 TaxID=3154278 RepID=UPI0033B2D4FA